LGAPVFCFFFILLHILSFGTKFITIVWIFVSHFWGEVENNIQSSFFLEWLRTETFLCFHYKLAMLNNSISIWNLLVLQLVLSTGAGVNGFTLDPSLGEFILTHPDIKVLLLSLMRDYYKLSSLRKCLPGCSACMKVRTWLIFLFVQTESNEKYFSYHLCVTIINYLLSGNACQTARLVWKSAPGWFFYLFKLNLTKNISLGLKLCPHQFTGQRLSNFKLNARGFTSHTNLLNLF